MNFSIRRFVILLIFALIGLWTVHEISPDSGWEYFVSFAFLASAFFICFDNDEPIN